MVTTKDCVDEEMILIIKSIQPFETSGSRKTRHHMNFTNASFLHCAPSSHLASLHERLENLWLIKSSND